VWKLIGLMLVVVACKHSAPVDVPAGGEPALDVMGFEPPFDEIPVAKAFIAKHHIKSIAVHEVDPSGSGPLTVRSSVLTSYNDDGAPTQVFDRGPGHDFELDLIATTIYVHDAAAMPATGQIDQQVVVVDASGRTTKRHALGRDETWSYDAAGHLIRIARDADDKHYEELRTYDPGGQLVKRTRGEVGEPPFETLELAYDHGRPSEWHGSKPGFNDDRYTFRYDDAGRLAEMRFAEGTKDIYQRTYTYDRDGFVTRVDLHASVPAMGNATFVYEYVVPEGRRAAIPVVLPGPPPQKTDADVLADVAKVFHPIAGTGAVVWDRSGKKPVVVTVSFDVTAKDADLTKVELAAKACALRQALLYQCDCETLERGPEHAGAVTLTWHVNLGC